MNTEFEDLLKLFSAHITNAIENQVREQLKDISNQPAQRKLYYNLKEVSEITGISVCALKGRIHRKTLKAAHDSTTILIPTKELDRLLSKLDKQVA